MCIRDSIFPYYIGSGPCICLEERSVGMEVTKKPKIKSIPYEEFTDNETLEKLVRELNAGGAKMCIRDRISSVAVSCRMR